MEVNFNRIQDLIDRPSESLAVELKTWIDPEQPEGIAKIVKTALALRNYNGGYMVIGFDNKTLNPDLDSAPPNVTQLFHLDKIQTIIAKYASEPFEIVVEYPERNGQKFPVIVIPPGVKTPVATKSELRSADGKVLISANSVYIRSLSANNTPSTTQAIWKDWEAIIEICFENREADVGRFIRRHLGSLTPDLVRTFTSIQNIDSVTSIEDSLKKYLQESYERYETVVKQRGITLPPHGAWEVGLVLLGEIPPHAATKEFLNLLDASNPQYTGWPLWLDSRNFGEDEKPFVFNGTWEALIAILDTGWSQHIDFVQFSPKGEFYLRTALEDDMLNGSNAPEPMTVLDGSLEIFRTAEAIAVGMAFAKAMGCEPEKTTSAFGFRWTQLQGRYLASWAQPRYYRFASSQPAYQDEVTTFIQVPLETPLSAIAQYVEQAVQPLGEVFNGHVFNKAVIEDLTRRLIERRF